MARKRALGFGFIPEETNHHFLVLIPKDNSSVKVYERFEWDENFENESLEESQHKVSISKHKWIQIKEPLQKEFNKRLKKYNLNIGRWSNGRVPVDRLLGKEMVLLMWAIEDSDPSVIPDAVKNWLGLTKEERWWLFTMTNASTGHAFDKRGWRKAVRYALTENPVDERGVQRNLIEELFRQHVQQEEILNG
ncbi:MAG TPA: DUF3780 domain-containing protein [Bacillota bacterium]|jgi:hypothetical protein|nr:DUF3780 domain-containing protein [Bacillota bacterium]